MRIAIDAHTLDRPPQGMRTYTEELLREVVALDLGLELVALSSGPMDLGVDDRLSWANWPFGRLYRLSVGPAREVHRHGCDAYHATYWVPIVRPKRVFVTIHDILPHTHPEYFSPWGAFSRRHWFKYSARYATHVFTISSYSRDAIISEFGISPERISITPCGVRPERYEGAPSALSNSVSRRLGNHPFMISVGRFDRRKNHETMLHAYVQLRSQLGNTCPLMVFAGATGDTEERIRRLVDMLGLGQTVVIFKNLNDGELAALVGNALCSISASFAEGFGLPNLEAMASGTPVISADNTAQREVVLDAGVLFRADDTDGLADAMRKVVTSEELRDCLRDRGRKRIEQYTWRKAAEAFAEAVLMYRS